MCYRLTMIISFYFVCVSAVLINKVSLQVTGVIGGSVLLPYSSTKHDLKLQEFDVMWRYKGSKIVIDIIKGKDSTEQQDPVYKDRTETFSKQYLAGDFSIKLKNLQHTDAGKYTCFILHSSESKTVELIISENGTKSTDKGYQKPETEAEPEPEAETSLLWVKITVPLVIMLILLMVACSFAFWKKNGTALFKNVSCSRVMTEDKEQPQINV